MSIVYLMLPLALLFGGGFLVAFLWSARRGQFDDLITPAHRAILDEPPYEPPYEPKNMEKPS